MLCKLNQEESKENSGNFKGTETPKEKKKLEQIGLPPVY